jgi:hypothetical protein
MQLHFWGYIEYIIRQYHQAVVQPLTSKGWPKASNTHNYLYSVLVVSTLYTAMRRIFDARWPKGQVRVYMPLIKTKIR